MANKWVPASLCSWMPIKSSCKPNTALIRAEVLNIRGFVLRVTAINDGIPLAGTSGFAIGFLSRRSVQTTVVQKRSSHGQFHTLHIEAEARKTHMGARASANGLEQAFFSGFWGKNPPPSFPRQGFLRFLGFCKVGLGIFEG